MGSYCQIKKYHHEVTGVNSRLDTIQAAVLDVKLRYLDEYIASRNAMASFYDEALNGIQELEVPQRASYSDHVFHQYTVKVKNGQRDKLKAYLAELGIPSMVYYPIPLYKQNAFKKYVAFDFSLSITEELCQSVLSLPIHTEGDYDEMAFISDSIKRFFKSI